MHGEETLRDFLLDAGLVSRSQLEAASIRAEAEGETLSKTLISAGIISEDELRRASASALGVPFVTLKNEDISPAALLYIPEPLARAHQLAAYASGDGAVEVALLSMDDLPAIERLRAHIKIKARLTTRDSIKRALLIYQKYLKEKFGEHIRNESKGDEALEALLSHALASGASDVHLEPRDSSAGVPEMLVRYRVEGTIYDAMTLPSTRVIASKIKELARLSHTLAAPQEGLLKIEIENGILAVRVSAMPTEGGERLSLRLMREPGAQKGFTLESLGFHGESLELLHNVLHAHTGLVVVSGPDRSGKTTLLYTLLDMLATPHRSLSTIEKNIELRLPYVAQTRTQSELGLTVASGLRALLRHDPDVVMISDVENEETAALAGVASRRMLVVCSTDDLSLIKNFAASIHIELMPRLCSHCKQEHKLTRADLNALETKANFASVLSTLRQENIIDKQRPWKDVAFYSASRGCSDCDAGYRGQIGVQEVTASAGNSPTIVEDAIFKAAQGLLSMADVVEVAQGE